MKKKIWKNDNDDRHHHQQQQHYRLQKRPNINWKSELCVCVCVCIVFIFNMHILCVAKMLGLFFLLLFDHFFYHLLNTTHPFIYLYILWLFMLYGWNYGSCLTMTMNNRGRSIDDDDDDGPVWWWSSIQWWNNNHQYKEKKQGSHSFNDDHISKFHFYSQDTIDINNNNKWWYIIWFAGFIRSPFWVIVASSIDNFKIRFRFLICHQNSVIIFSKLLDFFSGFFSVVVHSFISSYDKQLINFGNCDYRYLEKNIEIVVWLKKISFFFLLSLVISEEKINVIVMENPWHFFFSERHTYSFAPIWWLYFPSK